jgi:hypothetical protein
LFVIQKRSYEFSAGSEDKSGLEKTNEKQREVRFPWNGTVCLGVQEAFIEIDSVDQKLRCYLTDEREFDKLFTIYLKMHFKNQHFKSIVVGNIIPQKILTSLEIKEPPVQVQTSSEWYTDTHNSLGDQILSLWNPT